MSYLAAYALSTISAEPPAAPFPQFKLKAMTTAEIDALPAKRLTFIIERRYYRLAGPSSELRVGEEWTPHIRLTGESMEDALDYARQMYPEIEPANLRAAGIAFRERPCEP